MKELSRYLKRIGIALIIFTGIFLTGCDNGTTTTQAANETSTADETPIAETEAATISTSDFQFADGDSAECVTSNFTLPTATISGSTISWSSNNTDIISITDGTATVTPASEDTTITLTATVTDSDGNTASKTITIPFHVRKWKTVGNSGFSAGTAMYESLAIDSDNKPYVAYCDVSNSNKATVMMYDGSSWIFVGSAGFSDGAVRYTSLSFDSNKTPYVAYVYEATDYKVAVMKFDSTNGWETVGSSDISTGVSTDISLVLSPDNTPYVAYCDGGNNNIATVMKYE